MQRNHIYTHAHHHAHTRQQAYRAKHPQGVLDRHRPEAADLQRVFLNQRLQGCCGVTVVSFLLQYTPLLLLRVLSFSGWLKTFFSYLRGFLGCVKKLFSYMRFLRMC